MDPLRAEDPAETVVAWEAVEELLDVVPEGTTKDVLRMTAAGWSVSEIATHLGIDDDAVEVHAARGRIRVLTAAAAASDTDVVGGGAHAAEDGAGDDGR
jgi:DNA-directed RNA polymerase specialized sigma24 family protein